MSKKLFISLAPLLAITAFVVAPVAAQAAEGHYFKNSTLMAEGVKAPVIGWGTLTLSSPAATVTCHNAVGGEVENPTGGTAGKGATRQFGTWECNQTTGECKTIPGVVETRVVATSLQGEKVAPLGAFGTAWPSVIEGEGPFRTNTTVGAAAGEKKPVTGVLFECWVGGKFAGEVVFYGSSTPLDKNGTSASKPSTVTFDTPGSGELEAVGGALKGKTTGKAKVLGYEEQELITIN
jgi:hypothetical protein